MNKVYVVPCQDYGQVEERLADLLAMMGGMEQFVAAGERLVLKPNLLRAAEPDKAITTHPSVVAAVGKMAKAAGARPLIAESSGGAPYQERVLRELYQATGMDRAAKAADIELNLDDRYEAVSFPDGQLIKRFDVISAVKEAEGVINLCKFKTHTYMGMTGGVKNCFGVVPGLVKAGYHAKLHDPDRFASMLLDLSEFVSPRITIMDAVVGMEGDGPNNGAPRSIGWLLAAVNPLALDVVVNQMIGLPRAENPVLLAAERRGLLPNRVDQVELMGAELDDLRLPNFKLAVTTPTGQGLHNIAWWQRPLRPLFRNGFSVRPRVIEQKCVACGICRDSCPVKAISIIGGDCALIDQDECIRCYCCHEMCPKDAIELRQSWLYRFMNA